MDRLIKKHGFSPEDAAAIVGNLDAESGLNPNAVNPTSGAYGLKQGLGKRKLPRGTSMDAQIDDIANEFKTSEKQAYDELRKAKTLSEKTYAVAKYYERPSDREISSSIKRRNASAKTALEHNQKGQMQSQNKGSKIPNGAKAPGTTLQPKPIEDELHKKPDVNIPQSARDQRTSSLGGAIDLNIYQRDQWGRLTRDPVQHQLNLRGNRLDGEFAIDGINQPAFA